MEKIIKKKIAIKWYRPGVIAWCEKEINVRRLRFWYLENKLNNSAYTQFPLHTRHIITSPVYRLLQVEIIDVLSSGMARSSAKLFSSLKDGVGRWKRR